MLKANEMLDGRFLEQDLEALMQELTDHYVVDENTYLAELVEVARPSSQELQRVTERTTQLIESVRAKDDAVDSIDALLQQYSLSTQEGVILMCLAEALLRIPDAETADALIKDKLSGADFERYLKQSEHLFVNASTWGLMLTGKIVKLDDEIEGRPASLINRLINRCGEPVIRAAMYQAMRIMGKQFVLGRDIREALKRSKPLFDKGYTYSYDMLGEAARTAGDAERYYQAYLAAIEEVGQTARQLSASTPAPSVSIKLSALHPRYEWGKRERILTEMTEVVLKLIQRARELDVALTIDAEEVDRLELSLEIFERLYTHEINRGWGKLGLVVQAYSKRALPALRWLVRLAREQGDEIPVRLVKGAYWDSEIKESQQLGVDGYPVFTRKEGTDVAYLACAKFLLSDVTRGALFPQFATHNAHTVVNIIELAGERPFEYQRLHGMGEVLYEEALKMAPADIYCRIYAPVGAHKDLLPYLVRRLLENGANSSFVHRLVDAQTPVADLVQHPVQVLESHASLANSRIPLPPEIYGEERKNSKGVNLNIQRDYKPTMEAMGAFMDTQWEAGPLLHGQQNPNQGNPKVVRSPYDTRLQVGKVYWATADQAKQAVNVAWEAFPRWNATPVEQRAQCLEKLADLLEAHMPELMAICAREGGKQLQDGVDEVREAVDFCRYYALQARKLFGGTTELPGPTGESNELYLQGRGVFTCISPWNFPLAIFLGQISAAAVAGNAVLAKPAEQTSLIAWRAIQLMHEAGIPTDVVQLLPGDGPTVGTPLTTDNRITGVAFTGSTQTAHLINRNLANRENAPLAALVAETGGQNAMLVDSTALPEQVIVDVVESAFQSAGQRCSALRVLYLQNDVADRMIEVLKGAMAELKVGNPSDYATDVGPVIDADAREQLQAHIDKLKQQGKLIAETSLGEDAKHGNFVAPVAFEIDSINDLEKENFGPILHIVRYKASELDRVIEDINRAGYGLTLGIHSRNESFASYIDSRVRIGNVYVNRNQIGAVVGVQPFGGQGLSGTGPKAGGPHYLLRYATERTRTINTTALGGNAALLSLESE